MIGTKNNQKGVPVKKIVFNSLILTILLAVSASANLTIYFYGQAITKYSNLPETNFNLTLRGADTVTNVATNVKKRNTINFDTIISDTITYMGKAKKITLLNSSCSLSVVVRKKGFLFDSTRSWSTTCDSFSWCSGGWISDYSMGCNVYEKRPKITVKLKYTDSLRWSVDSLTIVDSQFLLISHNGSIISLNTTQRSYPWTASTIGDTVKIITVNADSSDTSKCYIIPTSIKYRVTPNLIPQKVFSLILNAQGRLIYKGAIDSKLKFSTGEYFIPNKTCYIKQLYKR
jgi:hypothetical protein